MKTNMKKIPYIILLSFLLFFITSCEQEPDRAVVVSKLKSSAKLATVEYVITKVVSAKNEKLLSKTYFFAESEATVKAGIDLNKLREEDIIIEGKKINITLPEIEIISFSYPADAIKVIKGYTYDSKVFTWNNFGLEERDELYRQAEQDIRNSIKDLGITKTAKKNTIKFLEPILRSVGYTEIYIQFKDDENLKKENKNLINQIKELKKSKKEEE